jgi:hypothetical protein
MQKNSNFADYITFGHIVAGGNWNASQSDEIHTR